MSEQPDTKEPAVFPLSASQRQIWTGQRLSPESPLYNMAMACFITGDLDENRFTLAWNKLIRSDDTLRIVVVESENEVGQAYRAADIPLQFINFSTHDDPCCRAQEWMNKRAVSPFQLHSVLVEAALLKLSQLDWVFFCNHHHLTTDASSFTALWRQLCNLYSGTPAEPEPTTSSYQQFVLRTLEPTAPEQTREQPLSPQLDPQKSVDIRKYWEDREQPAPLKLYAGNKLSLATRATRETGVLDHTRASELKKLAACPQVRTVTQHLSQYHVLLTVLLAYLYRVSGQTEISIDTPASSRISPATIDSLGLYIEMLPISVVVDTAETFASLLVKARSEVHTLLQNSIPGACDWVGNQRPSVVLNYVPVHTEDLSGMPVSTRWLTTGHIDRHHVLRMHVTDWNASGLMSIEIDFNDSCFDSVQRKAAIDHWRSLFDAMVQDIDTEIDRVDIVGTPPLEKLQECIASKPSHSSASLPTKICHRATETAHDSVIARFHQIAVQYSQDQAVSMRKASLTYGQLASRSTELAEQLQKLGIGRKSRVVIYMHRSLAIPVSVLGALECGSTYIPVEPDYPSERVHFLIRDSRADVVITSRELASRLAPGTRYLLLDEYGQTEPDEASVSIPQENTGHAGQASLSTGEVSGSDIAYCLYTSGSTGKPKGVEISHSAMWNYCSWAIEHYTNAQRLVFPLFTPLSFDLTVTSLFVPLLSGGMIRIYPQENSSVDGSLLDLLNENAIDIIKLTPAHLSMMQNLDMRSSRVRQLIVGGEDLKSTLAQKIVQSFGGKVLIHNEYGPTEATVGCIVHRFDPVADTDESVPIGNPVASMQAHVLNTRMLSQPPGVAGELYLSGPSLAQGYWQQPMLTKQCFMKNPAGTGETLYRTGDMVRFNAAGNLVYLGRCDDQIKIRGVRIEVSEIESAALSHPSVKNCVVTRTEENFEEFADTERFCIRCGLSSRNPESHLNAQGICSLCTEFENYKHRAREYFRPMAELSSMAESIRKQNTASYDCMMLLSGGKDSTYALARLADLELSVLAYTLDNGYLSNEAMSNITRVCKALGVDHEFGHTTAMPDIFVDSLKRHSNVCNGCFKTIYTLSMKRAQELNISHIFTGLSRGQFFETRLTEEIFTQPDIDVSRIDDTILSARKAYHRTPDAVFKLLDTRHFRSDAIFEQVKIVDFYRYCPVTLEDMLAYLQNKLPWVRPDDTGRSTNCLINDVGIYVHKKERGYHNYALPYSWDVRMGHKQREAALEELDDSIDEARVIQILNDLGYETKNVAGSAETRLVMHYTSSPPLSPEDLRQWLTGKLPAWMIPGWFMPLETMPLSKNGKILRSALPPPSAIRPVTGVEYVAPESDIEISLSRLWCKHLRLDKVGVNDNFFELGGDSLQAIRIAAELTHQGYPLKTSDLFERQTISSVAQLVPQPTSARLCRSREEPSRTPAAAFSTLKPGQLKKLSKLLSNK